MFLTLGYCVTVLTVNITLLSCHKHKMIPKCKQKLEPEVQNYIIFTSNCH